MKSIFLLSFAIGLLASSSISANACSCEDTTPRKELKRARAVFVGKVIQIRPADEKVASDETGMEPENSKGLFTAVKFRVEQYWKGVRGSEITIHSDQGVLGCKGYAFGEGKRYLVYARGKNLVVYTGCSISRPIERAAEALKELGGSKIPK